MSLGAGHMNFFVPRLKFLAARYKLLCDEWRRRGYSIGQISAQSLLKGIDAGFLGDYTPTNSAIELNRSRIAEKLRTMTP
jgi:deoxyribonuclease (pyrimidine dimer)